MTGPRQEAALSRRPFDETKVQVFDLEQPRTSHSPVHGNNNPPGYGFLLHRRHEPHAGRRTNAGGVIIASDHAGTHIDAICHQAENMHLYGGAKVPDVQTQFGLSVLGAETIRPLVTRGVLIDLVRHGSGVPMRDPISLDTVRSAAAASGVIPRAGDTVLIRTGAGRLWDDAPRYLVAPGVDAGVSAWLAEVGVCAVGADNLAWDSPSAADPDLGPLPGHLVLIVRRGIYILENLLLEELGDSGVSEFTFICLPLKLVGATASPVRPIALVAA